MKTYKVVRPHMGDKFYEKGDTRKANPSEVGHLIEKGILVEDETAEQDDGDGPPLTGLQRALAKNPLGAQSVATDVAESLIAEAVAEALAGVESDKASAVAQALADADIAAKANLQRCLDERAAEHAKEIENLKHVHAKDIDDLRRELSAEHAVDKERSIAFAIAEHAEAARASEVGKSETGDQTKIEPHAKDKADPKVKDKAAG